MEEQQWMVTVLDKANKSTNAYCIHHHEKPSTEQAALLVKNKVLGEGHLPVDLYRDEAEKNHKLMQHYGYKITAIAPADPTTTKWVDE